MSSMHQQHLNPDNMTMIEASLARVRSLYNLKRGSKDELHIAAVMIGEFQIGNNTEDGLYSVFLGSTQPTVHAMRRQQIQLELQQWDIGGDGPLLLSVAA